MKLKKIQVGMFLGESYAPLESGIKLETLLLAIARPSVLTECELVAVRSFQNALKNGYEIQLENSEFETFEKLNILEGFLGEGAVSQWFEFFTTGTSEEAVEKIKKDVESNIKTQEEYTKIKASIVELREKILNKGDVSHAAADIAMIMSGKIPLIIIFIVKHLYRAGDKQEAHKNSLIALTKYSAALDDLGKKKGWK
jgi:hypothetical protein